MMDSGMMQALWLEDQSLSFRIDLPIPVPGKGEALIKVSLAGVCSTDLELLRGYYPFSGIPGHEFVGRVVSSPADPAWLDKRVVGEITIACGECETCKSGLPQHCERRKTLGIHAWDGAFAEYLVLPIANLHVVPDHVSDEIAVFTEPLAAAWEILAQVSIGPEHRVLVIGAGRLGQLIAMVLRERECNLQVVTRHTYQRKLLAQLNIQTVSVKDLDPRMYDIVIEATGSSAGFTLAAKSIRPRGTIVLKSTYKGNTKVNFSAIVVDEVTLVGSRCGPFEPALKLLSDRKVDPRPLIEAVYPLAQGISAFSHAARPGALKLLLQPPDTFSPG